MAAPTRPSNTPQPARLALAPGLLGAVVLIAGLAAVGQKGWVTIIDYAVAILAIIVCVFAVQGRQWWWLVGLVPVAVLWNPVWPITLPELTFRLLHIPAAAVLIAAGLFIRVTPKG